MVHTNDLLNEAMRLSDDARTKLALELLDSVEPPDPLGHLDDEAWVEEIRRRVERAAAGESKGLAWAEVKARAEQKIRR